MSVPKQHHTKRRQARGRLRYVKTVKQLVSCPKCGTASFPHRVCPKCGFYKGREYIDTLKSSKAVVSKTKKSPKKSEKKPEKVKKSKKKSE